MTPEVAQKLVNFRFDDSALSRIDELACKCNEGELSDNERREYEAYVRVMDLIAILQAKSRAVLKRSSNG